ncbi:MAG: aminotransferase class I/II-fold pyridoxal phosphate-dependent enzyme [Elusimicrobia bacterium]|nr:aminotransferase class I/II-fold pyridoxal phosphate-dependent enzyme [Elusimicrobiota bacterium]
MKSSERLETKVIHAGDPHPRILGAVSMPVFQSSIYEYSGETSYHDLKYIRLNNTPNHQALHRKLASLEGAEDALVTGSGMAAISTALLSVLSSGDHLLAQDCLYGGTHEFIARDLKSFGVSFDFIDADKPASWGKKIRRNTKAIYVETMTNPLLQVGDLETVARFAKKRGLVSLIDNTSASPVNFRPAGRGFDLSLHSATKYLNGHSDIVAGAVIGSAALVERVTHRLNHLGGSLDPHACFLLDRGIKTLAVRMERQNRTALDLARFLERQPKVARVNYPGLESHPRHHRARELFDGFGGLLSFELKGGLKAAERFMRRVRLPAVAPSFGGVESLVTRPATTSHSGMPVKERRKLGIADGLVLVSVGLEAAEDVLADFEQALAAA